jgi:polysaccharide pyruvyl transferase WcaK-like protein
VRCLSEFVDYAVSHGYTPRFFPMGLKGSSSDDRPLIHEIIASARDGDKCLVEDDDLDTLTHLAEVAKCKLFVGHKTHSVIIALITGTPVVAIAYHRKTLDFMRQYELSGFCVHDRDLDGDSLIRVFERVCASLDRIARQEHKKSCEFSEAIRGDFRDMLENVYDEIGR